MVKIIKKAFEDMVNNQRNLWCRNFKDVEVKVFRSLFDFGQTETIFLIMTMFQCIQRILCKGLIGSGHSSYKNDPTNVECKIKENKKLWKPVCLYDVWLDENI